jgi:hypothetical protein
MLFMNPTARYMSAQWLPYVPGWAASLQRRCGSRKTKVSTWRRSASRHALN